MTNSVSNKVNYFQDVQKLFTQHMRDPDKNSAPEGIEDRRLKVYRELIYNNIEGFIASSFPVLRKIIKDEQWHKMLGDYVAHHQAHTPLFPKIPQEFLQYLQHERDDNLEDYPFLSELAHYEWIETAISIDPRELSFANVNEEGNLLEEIPLFSSLAMPLAYQWPVHKISPEFLPDSLPEEVTYIVVYRDRRDDVGFIELNPVAAKLIETCLKNDNKSGREILLSIVSQLQHPNPDIVINSGLKIMQDFKNKDIILGTKKNREAIITS